MLQDDARLRATLERIARDGRNLTGWERAFVDSLRNTNTFTPRQAEQIRRIAADRT